MQILRSLVDLIQFGLLFSGALIGFAIGALDAGAQTFTFEVTTLNSSGPGSLLEAINAVNASTATTKIINFDSNLSGTIALLTELPDITDGVTINGSTGGNIVVDGAGEMHIFRITSGTTTVEGLTLKNAPLIIESGASLEFDGSVNQQFDDVITDAGELVKSGNATLTLRGANDYTGGTLVRAGTLLGDTTSLQGDIKIESVGTLTFDQNGNGTYAGAITGTGAVQKTGTGVVTFTGGNTYAGGTTISAGTLRGDADSVQGDIAVNSAGTVIFDQDSDNIYQGNLSGAGKFIKNGAGILTLSGVNTISGQSSLNGGALLGDFASIPQKLSTAAGTLVTFDHTTDGTYAGGISGSGAVTKRGSGMLTLSGTNTYTGVTTVSAGTLRADPLRLPNTASSSILNNAALIFDVGGTGSYQGVISGTGSLSKIGNGTLSLTGAHSFSGLTSITAGRLDVDGSLAGGVNVGPSAVLGGTGSIGGTVAVNGTLAPGTTVPGGTIGTLSVGAVNFASGSVFEVEVNGSAADRLDVTGNANLGGATVDLGPITGNFAAPVSITILDAGSITGSFATLPGDLAFLKIDMTQVGQSIVLDISRNALGLSEFARTPNQSTIASALDAALTAQSDPDINTVFESLDGLTVDQVPNALASMTGESLTQFATTRLAAAERFGRALGSRVLDHQWASSRALFTPLRAAGEASGPSADAIQPASSPVFGVAMLGVGPMGVPGAETRASEDSPIRTWVDGSAIYGDVDGNPNESSFDYNVWGGSLGTDVLLDEHWVLGLAGGYAKTKLDFASLPGDGDVNTYQGAVYAGYVDPRFHLGVSGRYAYNDMEGKRDIRFGLIHRTARADIDGHDFGARFEGGLNLLDLGGVVLQPTASVNYNRLTQDDVTESGAGSLNLALEDYDLDSLVGDAGLRIRGRWEAGPGTWIVPELRGRFLYEFLDTDRLIEAQLVSAPLGASAFQIQGVELPRHSASVGLSWSVITDSSWSIIGSYDAVLNEDLVQHVGSVSLNFEW